MKKKIISALVVCTMTASMLIGCGSGKDGSGSSNSGGEERVWKFAHTRAEGTEMVLCQDLVQVKMRFSSS